MPGDVKTLTNQLAHVDDAENGANYTEDIDDQDPGNYDYDNIGNLIKDSRDSITNISWTVYGKIRQIEKMGGVTIHYSYDAAGNRVVKEVSGAPGGDSRQFYIRDAQGNTLALYRDRTTYLDWSEQHLYGSSRLGIWHYDKAVPATPAAVLQDSGSIGSTAYELTNHLGNVLSSISDKKIGVSSNGSTVDYYAAEVLSQNDYYPFGMGMPGRKFSNGLLYRFGFNGKENDNEVKGEGNQQDYGMRIYEPRLGRFLSVDPLTKKYPELTPYQFASNRPIDGIDLDGLEYVSKIQKFEYNGTWVDYVSAIDNGVIDILNIVPEMWNSGVANSQSLRRGTWTKDIGGELKQIGGNIKQTAVNTWNYNTKTPIGQQFVDTWNTIKDPQTLETGVSLFFGSKIKVPKLNSVVSFTSRTVGKLSGTWVAESTAGWSQRAIAYQEFVTGTKAGTAFEVGGVRFDGVRNNTLLEAKSSYDNFVNKKTGGFYSWFKGQNSLVTQARNQIKAANGSAIEWNFSSQKTLDATQKLFKDNNIEGITLKLNPQK